MADQVGQQFGNYRLLRLIGHGGFADVYLGEHIYMGTQAAIKLLHTQLGSKDIERFQQEARTVARLDHPHIVRVLEFGVQESVPYLVLSYAPNGTMRERHPRGTALPLPKIVEYVQQVADALQYAHNEKVIHRDIKPENMLIGKRNEIQLTDFGIALVMQNSRSASAKDLAGTAAYMAPEQIDAHPRASSDQYSLGIVVYEWLTGNCPFQGTFTEIALKHSAAPVPSLHEKMPNLPIAVESVVMTALAKDPTRRFASIQSFARALEQASRSASASADLLDVDGPTLRAFPLFEQTPPVSPQMQPAASVNPPTPVPPTALTPPNNQPAPALPVPPPMQPANQPRVVATPQAVVPPVSYTPVFYPPAPGQPASAERGVSLTPQSPPAIFVSNPSSASVTTPGNDRPPALSKLPTLALPSWRVALLVVLALLVVGGSVLVFYRVSFPQKVIVNPLSPQGLQTAIVNMQTSHQQSVNVYNQAAATNGEMFGFDAQHTRFNPYEAILGPNHIALVQAWAASTGGPIGLSSAAVANGMVYIGSHNGDLSAFDAISGQKKWVGTTGGSIDSSPAVSNGVVYIGSEDHKLYAFDAKSGQQKWAVVTGDMIDSSPTIANGVVYIPSKNGSLYAYYAKSGLRKWVTSINSNDILYSSPAASGGLVYIGTLNGNVYAFEAESGQQKWVKTTGGSIYSSPTVANGLVYIGSEDHKLYAFDALSGALKWARPTIDRIFASPAVVNGLVYINTHIGPLYAFDAVTGELKWESPPLDTFKSSPLVANGLVYLGSDDSVIFAFDASTGQKKGTFLTKGPVFSSPMVANGIMYAGAADGKLYAFHLAG